MSFALVYLAALFIPGYLISQLFNVKTQILLCSVSFSLFYFIVSLLIPILLKTDVASVIYVYSGGIIVLSAVVLTSRNQVIKIPPPLSLGHLIVIIFSSIYLVKVGIYDELPSDIYKHLEHFKTISTIITNNEFKTLSGFAIFGKDAQYWYYLPTLISSLLNYDFVLHVEVYAAINVIVLLVCLYNFSYWLYQSEIGNRLELTILCLLSVFFFSTHFGINVFSYIRYYSVAPTILNFIVYLTSIVCLFEYLRSHIGFAKFLILSSILFFTAYLLHAQEAMFIATIYGLVICISLFKSKLLRSQSVNSDINLNNLPNSLIPFTIATGLAAIIIYFYVINTLPLTRIIKPKIISVAELIGIGRQYFILNPFYQFYTVLTHWGLLIYVLYIIFYRRYFSQQPFLLATMLVPILTVFNPLFTDFFLRVGYSEVLWRYLYMLPLYLIAARVVTDLLFHSTTRIKLLNYSIIAAIFALLLPIKVISIDLPFSRIYSLKQPHHQARPEYWQDMLDYLRELPEKETIVTDPVTGYMLTALTKHNNRRYKFHVRKMRDRYIFDDYTDHPLKKYNGKLFILNLRKGMSTDIAKVSRHWNQHALKLTEYYNDALISHLDSEKNHFELLWQADDIKIYRINY